MPPPKTSARPPQPTPAHRVLQAKTARTQTPPSAQPSRRPVAPPVYRPQPAPGVLQSKESTPRRPPAVQERKPPQAPPAYRPQPTPRVLQRKTPAAPPVYRPQPTPKVLQTKKAPGGQSQPAAPQVFRPAPGRVAPPAPPSRRAPVAPHARPNRAPSSGAVQPLMRGPAGFQAAARGGAPARNVIQRGTILHHAGISDEVELKAQAQGLEDELSYAVTHRVSPNVIEPVFRHAPNNQLANLPAGESSGAVWDELKNAHKMLGQANFDKWTGLVGVNVRDMSSFKMLLSDKNVTSAFAEGMKTLAESNPPPRFSGKSYHEITGALKRLGYRQQESFLDVRDPSKGPYGQDVWTHDNKMVVRIKVGGRSLNGRFQRPPHVVKEISGEAHAYGAADIVCKLTDENILIPAGTKFSAKDMQTWYVAKTERVLSKDAWKDPHASGDDDFTELHQLWAEGAHTAIGAGLAVPEGPFDERRARFLALCQKANTSLQELDGVVDSVLHIVQARGQNKTVTDPLISASDAERGKVYAALNEVMQAAGGRELKGFHSKLHKFKERLEGWKTVMTNLLSAAPAVKERQKPFFVRLFSDAKLLLTGHDATGWKAFNSPYRK